MPAISLRAGNSGASPSSGPTLRGTPTYFGADSPSVPSVYNVAVPAATQVGDYLVLMSANALPGGMSGWTQAYSPTSTGASFNNLVSCLIKVATPADLGTTVQLAYPGGSVVYDGMLFAISNPNSNPQPSPQLDGKIGASSGGNVSSLVFAAEASPSPFAMKVTGFGANGSSNFPYPSWSGNGTLYSKTDSYWSQSCGVVLEPNAVSASGTASWSNPVGVGWMTFWLL